MLSYSEFKDAVASSIKNYLNESYQDATISIVPVLKNNNLRLDGLTIRRKDEAVCPNVYINGMYDQYKDGRELEDILSDIARIRQSHGGPLNLDVAAITDWEQVKTKVLIKLVNSALNAEYLEGKPHKDIADLSAIYYIDLGTDICGNMTTVITDALLSQYGVSVEELHQTAVQNMGSKARFCSMFEVLSDLMGENAPTDEQMLSDTAIFVLSNEKKINGFSVFLCPEVMDDVAEKVGTDFYIIGSSIHEGLVIPRKPGIELDSLLSMVKEVNATQVSQEERVSDHVYRYSYVNHCLEIAA